jgi:flagellar assembly protein FliH
MALTKLITFNQPLISAKIKTGLGAYVTTVDFDTKMKASYQEGYNAARSEANVQLVELRADMQRLSDEVLKKLAQCEALLLGQLREALPDLAIDISKRLLSGYTPSAEVIEAIAQETLSQLYPEKESLELHLCPKDAQLLETANPAWRSRYTKLTIVEDESLNSADCVVRSRFGVTDARISSKLKSLANTLSAQ